MRYWVNTVSRSHVQSGAEGGFTQAPIQPLIEHLEFIKSKKSWGFTFRRGFFEIGEGNFKRIVEAMKADVSSRA